MSGIGGIVFSETSDMNIWLCHQSDLLPDAINELQQKASAIEEWSKSLELDVRFWIIDSKQFRLGKNAPSATAFPHHAQHHLLLEEF